MPKCIRENFRKAILDVYLYGEKYFIQKSETTINTGMSNNFSTNKYACHGAQVLIPEN